MFGYFNKIRTQKNTVCEHIILEIVPVIIYPNKIENLIYYHHYYRNNNTPKNNHSIKMNSDVLSIVFEYCEQIDRRKLRQLSPEYSKANQNGMVHHQVKRKITGMYKCRKRRKFTNIHLDCYMGKDKYHYHGNNHDEYKKNVNMMDELKIYFELNSQIKRFEFGNDFNIEITRGIFPENLKYLTFGKNYTQKIKKEFLPKTLTYLKIGNNVYEGNLLQNYISDSNNLIQI